jgi:pimeloyl-ACP methyl ester carboxylesterase
MSENAVTVVLAHGAWADGSSWSKVISSLRVQRVKSVAAPLPLTSLPDDVAALERTLERVDGPVVLVGHAYAGAVIAGVRSKKIRSLVYIAALAPAEGETVADVFNRAEPHPMAPKLAPDRHSLQPPRNRHFWLRSSGRSRYNASASRSDARCGWSGRAGFSSPKQTA